MPDAAQASLVVQGAIPAIMFNEADTEHFALFAKIRRRWGNSVQ